MPSTWGSSHPVTAGAASHLLGRRLKEGTRAWPCRKHLGSTVALSRVCSYTFWCLGNGGRQQAVLLATVATVETPAQVIGGRSCDEEEAGL